MCIICVELQQNKLTSIEARRNLREIGSIIEKKHRIEVLRFIWEKEDDEASSCGSIGCVGSD